MAEPRILEPNLVLAALPPRSLPLDQEADRIFEHAYQIGLAVDERDSANRIQPPISFTTLLIALLLGTDKTSTWFAGRAAENGPKLDLVKNSKELNGVNKSVPDYDPITPASIRLSHDNQLLTVSARAVLNTAEEWAHRVGGSDIGVRHLVASYVLNPPPNHRSQMRDWTFKESNWRREFFAWVAVDYTAEQWTDAQHRPAPSQAAAVFEQQKNVKGEDLAFPSGENSTAVLAKAALFHSSRNDTWLRLQTVFFALIETARTSNNVRNAIEPIWNAVVAVNKQYEEARDLFLNLSTADPTVTFSNVDISPRVLNALETARELTVATSNDGSGEVRVGVLHLAGALISRRVDSDEDLARLGLTPQKLRDELIAHAAKNNEPLEVWREALGEEETLESGRPVDLNSDEPEAVVRLDEEWKSDPLAIRPDVEAFAALLASKSLEPPLSIGLFGPWGSGKTTFLRRLRRAVERRAGEAKKRRSEKKTTPYVSNVVHVDFNAWHFAEDALTSSLVDKIFREIDAHISDSRVIAGKAWKDLKREVLETTKRKLKAAEETEATARQAVDKAQKTLGEARVTAARATTTLHAAVQGVWAVTKKTLRDSAVVKETRVFEELGDTVNSAEELQKKLNTLRTRPVRLLNDLGIGRSIIFAALVLLVPPLTAWLVGSLITQASSPFGQILSTMSALSVVIGAWLRTAARAVGKMDQAIAEVDAKYEEQIATNPAVIAAQQSLQNAEVTMTTAEISVQAAREALASAQTDARNASLPAQMLQLVSSRIEDQTYNKELTTLSLARADLEALSTILRDQNSVEADSEIPAPQGEKPPRPVDRVILYIDDLDRCEPKDVVRVLQLAHMLLAFELFVVVVAVDARWIEESLINRYTWLRDMDSTTAPIASDGQPHQSPSRGRVTPQDYLEKIFQISFWLEPMSSARAASYLGSLVRPRTEPVAVPVTPDTTAEPVQGKIDIGGVEADYMRALAAHVGPSPRRVKRLVNAYRLIKARLSEAQLKTFLEKEGTDDEGKVKSGPYQLVIGLLVIGTGAPATSVQIFRELSECDPRDTLESVVERFKAHDHHDWDMAAKVIETLMRTQRTKDVSELRGWARKVGRFLLNSPSADVLTVRPHTLPTEPETVPVQAVLNTQEAQEVKNGG